MPRNERTGTWEKAAKDIAKLNRLVAKVQKKPAEADATQADLKKMTGLAWWMGLCFAEAETDRAFDLLDELKVAASAEKLLAFFQEVRKLVSDAAPESFNYSGFAVSNPERVSDRLCREALGGIDYMIALFKKRDVSELLREGVTSIRILPSDVFSSGGSYNIDTRCITLDTAPKQTKPSSLVFIDWMNHAFLHEFGHHVHTNFLPPAAVAAWDEAWDGGDKPSSVSQYGSKNKFEDFAETFVAFMAAPGHLTPDAKFRMQRTFSIAGLYGKPIMRLALRVAARFTASRR